VVDRPGEKPAPGRSVIVRGRLLRAGENVGAVLLLLVALSWALDFPLFDGDFFTAFVWRSDGESPLVRGLVATVGYTALVIPTSVAVGFAVGWARTSRYKVLAWPAASFVEFLRGVPALILVIFAFLFGSQWVRGANQLQSALLLSALALALHSAAYQAEIFRAGFESVPRGQTEAARALGLTGAQVMRHVALPQALRLALPPLGNEFATLVKDTALLAAVGASELFAQGLEFSQQVPLQGRLEWVFPIWLWVAALYFVITIAVTRSVRAVEKRFQVPGLRGLSH
jgi:His/Glu/Gln/Arg/opine family amino acid ABC transporter permease subunit